MKAQPASSSEPTVSLWTVSSCGESSASLQSPPPGAQRTGKDTHKLTEWIIYLQNVAQWTFHVMHSGNTQVKYNYFKIVFKHSTSFNVLFKKKFLALIFGLIFESALTLIGYSSFLSFLSPVDDDPFQLT